MTSAKRSYLSQIFKAYNQTKAHARRAGDLKCIDRLNKALGILMSANYYQDQKATYAPTSSSCNCKDWEFRHAARRQYGGPCKHMHAESILLTASTNFLFTQNRTSVSIPLHQGDRHTDAYLKPIGLIVVRSD